MAISRIAPGHRRDAGLLFRHATVARRVGQTFAKIIAEPLQPRPRRPAGCDAMDMKKVNFDIIIAKAWSNKVVFRPVCQTIAQLAPLLV
jgi:hypothetical protein